MKTKTKQSETAAAAASDIRCFTLPTPWWSPDGVSHNKIHITDAHLLQKRMGERMWDGLLYMGDSITNPILVILANKAGNEVIATLRLYSNRKELEDA